MSVATCGYFTLYLVSKIILGACVAVVAAASGEGMPLVDSAEFGEG